MQAELLAALKGNAKAGLKRVQSKAAMDMAALREANGGEGEQVLESQGGRP